MLSREKGKRTFSSSVKDCLNGFKFININPITIIIIINSVLFIFNKYDKIKAIIPINISLLKLSSLILINLKPSIQFLKLSLNFRLFLVRESILVSSIY